MRKFRLPTFVFLTIFFGIVQFLNISIFGVKPNFVLTALVVFSFFISDFWEGFFLSAMGAFLLKFSSEPQKEIFAVFVIGMVFSAINKYLPWRPLVGNVIILACSTLIYYAVSYPFAIWSLVFAKELVYNLILGTVLFLILNHLNFKKK
ncbi:MAG: hypothetical protein QMD86_00785 [Patescibacteria group bacterium]|nr:hypothetical protein [Patescibacteria group bacterium]